MPGAYPRDPSLTVAVADSLDELYPYTLLRELVEPEGIRLALLRCRDPEEVVARCAGVQAIIDHWLTFDRRVIAALPACRALLRYGIGYELIDVQAATEHGMYVCNTPRYCTDEVAEHTLALLLASARRIVPLARHAAGGKWSWDGSELLDRNAMHRLHGRTLGVVGFGSIGRAVAERARGFGMAILAHDPYADFASAGAGHVTPAPLADLLTAADYVSLHVPLTAATRGLIDGPRLRLMKPTAILLNMSRGPVVDEAALIRALREGRIAGAALDVLAQEPPDPANPLLHMDQVIVTPHYGAASAEAIQEQHREIAESLIALARGERPRLAVNRIQQENRRSSRRVVETAATVAKSPSGD